MQFFRGFFILFWFVIFFSGVSTFISNFKQSGQIIGMKTFKWMFTNFLNFAIIDTLMLLTTFAAPLFQIILYKSSFITFSTDLILQHTLQSSFFMLWFTVGWGASWSWIQSGSFVLHTISMLFKIHSYNEFHRKVRDLPLNSKAGDNKSIETYASPSLKNFFWYLLYPTLVYEAEYPKVDKIRPFYVFQKAFSTSMTILCMYMTVEHYILPVVSDIRTLGFITCMQKLILPFVVVYLMVFLVIFECICNGFAELTRFGDRNFYDDWWNSTSFDQFARKWNKPVHEFLLRHVYLESIETHKFSKSKAAFVTFLFSSCLHELVMIMVSKKIKMYLFVLQMTQIPLIYIGRLKWTRRHPVFGNLFFWISMLTGLPLLTLGYCWEFYDK
jgi:sterol O-acyltransferase